MHGVHDFYEIISILPLLGDCLCTMTRTKVCREMFGLCCRVFIFLIYLCPFPLIKWGSSSWGTLLIRTKDFSNSEFFFLTFFFGYFIPARSNHNLQTPVWHPSHMLYTSPNISYSLSTDCSRVFVGTL